MAFEDVIINDFMDCWFKKDYSKISEDDFGIIYGEYMDTSGMFATAQFDLVIYIQDLSNRINSINYFIEIQNKFLKEFGVPYVDHFSFVEKFGHKLIWKDNETFIKDCKKILLKERKYHTILKTKENQLIEERKKQNNGEVVTDKQTRQSFIRMLNSLSKIGYNIDRTKTTVEELALMLKQHYEESEKIK